jgi:hypothetical protein
VQGYVYVLVNSSMPGLVKVGKTTRPLVERVAELSAPTGVPTPFVVAFQRPFDDIDAAERYVHDALEQRGLRVATRREFFRATADEAIKVVVSAPGISGQNIAAGISVPNLGRNSGDASISDAFGWLGGSAWNGGRGNNGLGSAAGEWNGGEEWHGRRRGQ